MKIAQISPGLIEIPPKGWGAIEKIIWNYKINLEKLNHICDIRYTHDDLSDYDIIHAHVWNQALELYNKGIPYIFTMHDSHIFANGKNDFYYKNLEAIKKSIITIFPSKYHFSYFEALQKKMTYLPHGVDTNHYKVDREIKKDKNYKLLHISKNNPMGGLYDNKGFEYSVNIAKMLNLPITIAGPNDEWFRNKPDNIELSYNKLNIINKNLSDMEVIDLMSKHDIFVHKSIYEAGQPCLVILEALSCGMPVLSYKRDKSLQLNGVEFITSDDLTESHLSLIKISEDYNNYCKRARMTAIEYDWKNIALKLEKLYLSKYNKKNNNEDTMRDQLIKSYSTTIKNENNFIKKEDKKQHNISVNFNFIEGAFCEILGENDLEYDVTFIDNKKNEIVFDTKLKPNHWCKTNRKWFTDYKIIVKHKGEEIHHTHYNAENKRVYIAFDSSSLGDTIAWIPYVEEFRKKHNCSVIVSTFWNKIFKKSYPNIEFVEPGQSVENIYAMYKLGVFGDGHSNLNENVNDTRKEPLQKIACDILGLEYKEIRPDIKLEKEKKENDGKVIYIVFDSHSLGDTLAWIPYVDEYRKIKGGDIKVCTSWNYLFRNVYPELDFKDRDTMTTFTDRIDIGLYEGENNKSKSDYRNISLQQAASEILGLDHREIKPKIMDVGVSPKYKMKKKKYVTLAIQSTAQAKYWNYPNGWQEVVNYLKSIGYDVVVVDKHSTFGIEGHWNKIPTGVIDETGSDIKKVLSIMKGAEFHLGISAGLSWLAWSVDLPVIMISGFSKPWTEFETDVIRLHDTTVCNGCYNNTKHSFDKDNWLWCPENKDFECSKSITPDQVIRSINEMIEIKKEDKNEK